jgi:uroporphyrinogen III methyltransferase / synthase
MTRRPRGWVAFVGAGPGSPDLLTVRGRDLLARADVVVADAGVDPAVRALAVAGRTVEPGPTPKDTASVLVAAARSGEGAVRLVAGDPFLDPGAVAEAGACARARVSWEVVPGLVPAVAGATYAGIPLALPGPELALVGPVGADAELPTGWSALAAGPATLVLTLAADLVGKVATRLLEHGRPGDTPVALVAAATAPAQRTLTATLDDVETTARAARLAGEVVMVVGDAVAERDRLSWWESRPLFGLSVLVPRARAQADELCAALRAQGARPVELPTIAIEPPRNPAALQRALSGIVSGRYGWVAFTSVNAVSAVTDALDELSVDARAFADVKVAAVGAATAEALRSWGLRADLVPAAAATSEALAAEWPRFDPQLDFVDRVLLPRADIATPALVAGVKERGWTVDEVTAYRTVRAPAPPAALRDDVRAGRLDAVVLTSSSTVRNLVALTGGIGDRTLVAAIGPATAATCRELGLRVDVQARESTVPGLVAALADHVLAQRAAAEAAPVPPKRGRGPAPAGRPAQRPSAARASRVGARRS